MWYRSTITKKTVNSTSAFAINNIYGEGAFDKLVKDAVLEPLENPSVIDVLRETRSTNLAILRYKEIHKCTTREAVAGVTLLKKDMGIKPGKKGKKKWKKRNAAKTVSTENQSATGK